MKFEKCTLFLSVLCTGILLTACTNKHAGQNDGIKTVSGDQPLAGAAYLTQNHAGVPVLVWTGRDREDADDAIYYAVFDEQSGEFGKPVLIPETAGSVIHAESMNKVTWTQEGFTVAVFEVKHRGRENQYAGSIHYTQSFDGGESWSASRPVHSDTTIRPSRSFFDVETLPDGEVGIAWLDGRNRSGDEPGTSLFFTKTDGMSGFLPDRELGTGICECCRTALHTTAGGELYLLYRNIFEDSVRDLAYLKSIDSGETFSSPVRFHEDNWVIHGCPHSGPDMRSSGGVTSVAWYTMGDQKGVVFTLMNDREEVKPAQGISETAVQPQLDMSGEGYTGVAWVERNHPSAMLHFQVRNGFEVIEHIEFDYERVPNVEFPVVLNHGSGWIIAWTEKKNRRSEVKYTIVRDY